MFKRPRKQVNGRQITLSLTKQIVFLRVLYFGY